MKILSLNGGGSLGYITLGLLERLEEEAGMPCYKIFDLISGVSTGAIAGFGLANGSSAKEIKELYKKFIPSIFKNKSGLIASLWKPYYDIKNLEKSIQDNFGNTMLSSAKTNFMCYATKLNEIMEKRA